MKNIILLIIITSLFSCSDLELNNNNEQTNQNEPDFLLESIVQNHDADEDNPVPYQFIERFEYDSNNNPIFFYQYYANIGNTVSPIPELEFIYDIDNILVEIIRRNSSGELQSKSTFLTFNDQEAEIFVQEYNNDGSLMTEGSRVHLLFENLLIKHCEYYMFNDNSSLYYGVYFEHDAEGRLTNVNRYHISGQTYSDEITQWHDNIYPDNISNMNNLLGYGVLNFFPKHYNSTKIPNTATMSNIQYNINNTVSNFSIGQNDYSKNYIPRN